MVNIPDAAVEEAARVLLGDDLGREVEDLEGELWRDDIEARKDLARAALEAAAPYIWTDEWNAGYKAGQNDAYRKGSL